MSRRSRRLLEAKESSLQNGSLLSSTKKMKLDKTDMEAVDNIEDRGKNAINNRKKENHKASSPKKSKSSLKDIPLKERMKITSEKRDAHGNFEVGNSESKSNNVNDNFEVEDTASTSHTCTEITTGNLGSTNTEGGSLAIILSQGLTSSDTEKIDAVLSKADIQVISATVNDLPVTQIIPLLKEIEYRCQNRRHFDSCWVRWLQCVFSKHMAYLCTISTLKEDLSSLFNWFNKRMSSVGELLQVSGKLSLINEQISRRMCPQMFVAQQPTISFEDDGDDSSEISADLDNTDDEEDVGSVEEWWDDDEIGSNENGLSSDDEERESRDNTNFAEDEDLNLESETDDEDGSDNSRLEMK